MTCNFITVIIVLSLTAFLFSGFFYVLVRSFPKIYSNKFSLLSDRKYSFIGEIGDCNERGRKLILISKISSSIGFALAVVAIHPFKNCRNPDCTKNTQTYSPTFDGVTEHPAKNSGGGWGAPWTK